jgi:predicted ester cyclase
MGEQPRVMEENKALLSRLFEEAFHQGNLTIVDDNFSTDFIDHSTPNQVTGSQGVKDYFIAIRAGFPDIRVTIDDLIAEADRVVVRSTWYGTHLGVYEGFVPTGKQVTRTLIQMFRVANGKIVEEWNEGGNLLDAVLKDSL